MFGYNGSVVVWRCPEVLTCHLVGEFKRLYFLINRLTPDNTRGRDGFEPVRLWRYEYVFPNLVICSKNSTN